MTSKIVNSIKSVCAFAFILASIIACEKDFENIGTNIVDNNLFTTKDSTFSVITYNKDVDSSRVDGMPLYSLGVFNDKNFGLLEASFISQLSATPPTSGVTDYFGLNPKIDTVVLDIPYFATRGANTTDNKPSFTLDSINGDQTKPFQLKIYRLGTFLNTLDPTDPTKRKRYYSNEDNYIKLAELSSRNFIPNSNDTILFVKRKQFSGEESIDSVTKTDKTPSIKLALDSDLMKQIFIDDATLSDFESFDRFSDYFRGILIESKAIGPEYKGSIMKLAMNNAIIRVFYTNEVLTDESGTDLNGNGTTDDLQVPVLTKQIGTFPLAGVRTSIYNRDYSMATSDIVSKTMSPDKINGEDKLFIQGSEGTIAEIELFKNEDISVIRNLNWLINGAILEFYVNQDASGDDVPTQLYLYKEEEINGVVVETIIKDVLSEIQTIGIGGVLERDSDNKPLKYRFSITDYISDVLKSDNPTNLSKLKLKVHNSFDVPTALNDTVVKNFSWKSKGVVLKGNNLLPSDPEIDKKLKLKIYYTVN